MAKLGMPSVNISFIEAGIEAIERSQRGIVALLFEESQETIDKIKKGYRDGGKEVAAEKLPLIIYTTDDIPSIFTDANKDYITKCLMGYKKSPYRVKIYLQAANNANAKNADKFAESLKTLSTERWDYLAIPTIVTE